MPIKKSDISVEIQSEDRTRNEWADWFNAVSRTLNSLADGSYFQCTPPLEKTSGPHGISIRLAEPVVVRLAKVTAGYMAGEVTDIRGKADPIFTESLLEAETRRDDGDQEIEFVCVNGACLEQSIIRIARFPDIDDDIYLAEPSHYMVEARLTAEMERGLESTAIANVATASGTTVSSYGEFKIFDPNGKIPSGLTLPVGVAIQAEWSGVIWSLSAYDCDLETLETA